MSNTLPTITVIGAGYVGMSIAALFSKHANVKVWDTDSTKQEIINSKKFTIADEGIKSFFNNLKHWNITATSNFRDSLKDSKLIILALPTNYDNSLAKFDTSALDATIMNIAKINSQIPIIVKSTVPIGYCLKLSQKTKLKITFAPEFIREGHALKDNEYPSRIILGTTSDDLSHEIYLKLVKKIIKNNPPIMNIPSCEAEAVKLFSNSYLAMRVAFFNELDSFVLKNSLSSKNIIEGLSYDQRIGAIYNNPSFGYGGYCLPKDTKQLVKNLDGCPKALVSAITHSNEQRKEFIVNYLIEQNKNTYGFFRINMKEASDNFRESPSIDLIKALANSNKNIIIYEPLLDEDFYHGIKVINDLEQFKVQADIIVANMWEPGLSDCMDRVFTRDISFRIDTK